MSLLKNTFLNFSNGLPIGFLKRISPIDIYLPYHHLVREDSAPFVKHLYSYKNKKQFVQDIDFLLKNFEPADIDHLVSYVKGEAKPKANQLLLTFDDGFKEAATTIAPILYQKGVPAIFFLNNEFIGNKKLFYRLKISLLIEELINNPDLAPTYQKHLLTSSTATESLVTELKKTNQLNQYRLDEIAHETGYDFQNFLDKEKPFVTGEQVDGLVKMGFTIGGHSLDHPYFELLDEQEQCRQAISSANSIKERFHQKYSLLSFPHSDSNIRSNVLENILRGGVDVLFGIQNQLPEIHHRMLHRFNAERPEISLKKQVKAEMMLAAILKIFGQFKVKRT